MKAKKSGGELLAINELFDRAPTKVNNYGVWLRYDNRKDTVNMYKEFRDVTINGALSTLYQEMAGRHRAEAGSIQIINTAVLPANKCRRDHKRSFKHTLPRNGGSSSSRGGLYSDH